VRRKRFVFLLLLLALLLTACGAKKGGLRVEGAWGRPSPKMAMAGAFYMTISYVL
jgi:copper(I)-binding protein